MMMGGVRLHTRHVCSASIWVAAFGCSFTFIRTQNHLFSASTKTLESWAWDCNQVADWIPDEHAERSLFRLIRSGWPTSSLITNMRFKDKILGSSNFFTLARDPDFPPFVWSNLTKPALPESADLFLKILPDEEIRCFACGLGTDVDHHLFVCHLVFMQRKPGQTGTARPPPRVRQQLTDGGLVVDLWLLTITADFIWIRISPTRQNDRTPAITWWPDL